MPTSSPYPGLAPFREEDGAIFFGREEEVQRSIDKLLANRFLAIVGPSGIGKSSLLQAGIIPQLRAQLPHVQHVVYCRFAADPIANLAAAVSVSLRGHASESSPQLLVIDQFEELYTTADDIDRQNVLNELTRLLGCHSLLLIIALRADFFGRLIETPTLAEYSEHSTVLLSPLSRTSMQRAIAEPARLAGLSFESGLIDRILSDVGSGVASLPLLQMALNTLASSVNDRVITFSDYELHGSVHGALERRLEGIWSACSESDRYKIRSIMLRLVTLSDGSEATRRAVALETFPSDERNVLNRLVFERVLTVHQDCRSDQTVVEVTHESIFRAWSRFSEWLAVNREFLRLRHRVMEAVEWWDEANRDSSYLLTGGLLERAREMLESWRENLTPREIDFVRQSVTANQRFSAWKLLTSGLGLSRLQSAVVERDERRAVLQDEIDKHDEQIQQLNAKKARLMSQLQENRKQVESISPRIFLSYASEDFPLVKTLYDKLKENGLRPWLDREDLLPGVDWDREIVSEIKQAHFVLFCLSSRSVSKRGYVQKELRTALRVFDEIPAGQTYLIPVRIEECGVPDEVSKYQCADIFCEGGFDKMLRSIVKQWAASNFHDQAPGQVGQSGENQVERRAAQ